MPKQALTVGVGTVMDARYELLIFMLLHKKENAREVMVLITGANKSIALYKAIEEGVCHMWTVSAFQQHNNTLMVCDEDATLELRVRTVKYFKVSVMVHNSVKIYKIIDLFWPKVVSEKIQPLIFARDLSF